MCAIVKRKVILSLVVAVLLLAGVVAGGLLVGFNLAKAEAAKGTPLLIHCRGALYDPSTGNPMMDGQYQFTFSIYDCDVGGDSLWQESRQAAVQDGMFSVLLGDEVTLYTSLFDGSPGYLGIKLEDDEEMTPRQLLAFLSEGDEWLD